MAAPHDSVIRPDRLLLATDDSEAAMLAVGSRGLGAVCRARLGSVSTNVLRTARGPVLIYSRSAGETMGRISEC